MHVTGPPSSQFDPSQVKDPERRGAVAWSQFNVSYERFLETPWYRVNRGRRLPLFRRLARLLAAAIIAARDAIEDLPGKARALARLPLPRDPDIVFFGAESGTEALLLRALFGDGGRLVLIDADPAAYDRYIHAPDEVRVRDLVLRRDRARIEYVRADFFDVDPGAGFDVGLDWGLLEHYDARGKSGLLNNFRRFLKPGGVEVSVAPRDVGAVRLFYRLFSEELNFGHRELFTVDDHRALFAGAGFEVVHAEALPGSTLIGARKPAG